MCENNELKIDGAVSLLSKWDGISTVEQHFCKLGVLKIEIFDDYKKIIIFDSEENKTKFILTHILTA